MRANITTIIKVLNILKISLPLIIFSKNSTDRESVHKKQLIFKSLSLKMAIGLKSNNIESKILFINGKNDAIITNNKHINLISFDLLYNRYFFN